MHNQNNFNTFKKMLEESERQNLPLYYRSDLDIDKTVIEHSKGESFVWVLRESGTQIARLNVGAASAFIEFYATGDGRNPNNRFYLVEPHKEKIVGITSEKAVELIKRPPALNTSSIQAVYRSIHDVLTYGVENQLWGLFSSPKSVECMSYQEWSSYFSENEYEPMASYMKNALSCLKTMQQKAS